MRCPECFRELIVNEFILQFTTPLSFGCPVLLELDTEGAIFTLAFSPDGARLAVGTCDMNAAVHIFSQEDDWETPVKLTEQTGVWGVISVRFSHDGRLLSVGTNEDGGVFSLWDHATGICLREWTPKEGDGHACAFSPADDMLALGGEEAQSDQDATTGSDRSMTQFHLGKPVCAPCFLPHNMANLTLAWEAFFRLATAMVTLDDGLLMDHVLPESPHRAA